MEVNSQSIVSKDNYDEIKNMLTAPDEASKVLAITILEQSDYKESEVYILTVLKDSFRDAFSSTSEFQKQAADLSIKVCDSLGEQGADIVTLSYKEIYAIAIKRDKKEEIEFILDCLSVELIKSLEAFGYEFMEFTDVLIKPKGWMKEYKSKMKALEEELKELKLVPNG